MSRRVAVWMCPTVPSVLTGDLDTDLGGWDELVVHGGVHPVPGRVGVGGEEDPVAGGDGVAGVEALGAVVDEREVDGGVGAAGVACGEGGLGLADVLVVGGDEAGQVRLVDGVVVDEHEVADTEAGE